MSLAMTGIVGIIVFLIVVFSGVPISFAMLFTGFWGLCFLRSPVAAFDIVAKDLFSSFSCYSLAVLPVFGFLGCKYRCRCIFGKPDTTERAFYCLWNSNRAIHRQTFFSWYFPGATSHGSLYAYHSSVV